MHGFLLECLFQSIIDLLVMCISDFISSIQLESTLNASNCCTVAGAAVEAEVVGTDFVRAATPEDTSDCDTSDERDGSDDVPPGAVYKFVIGQWSADESLKPGRSCTKTDGIFVNRIISSLPADPYESKVLDPVCWENCLTCQQVESVCIDFEVTKLSCTDRDTERTCTIRAKNVGSDDASASVLYLNTFWYGLMTEDPSPNPTTGEHSVVLSASTSMWPTSQTNLLQLASTGLWLVNDDEMKAGDATTFSVTFPISDNVWFVADPAYQTSSKSYLQGDVTECSETNNVVRLTAD